MTEKLPLETQTLYAELLEQLTALEAQRSIGRARGGFTTKQVRGEAYYYFQFSEPGGKIRQAYIGRKEPVLEGVVARFEKERGAFHADWENVQRLCAILRAAGALTTDTTVARVLKSLADSGVFKLGGMLLGTQAFAVIGNMLGCRWKGSALTTHDIDIAGVKSLAITMPEIEADVPGALEVLEMGFLPVPALDPRSPSTSFKVRGKALRVDLLTPSSGPPTERPVPIPRFAASARPLPYLDYLMEHPVPAAVVNGGGILVNVPDPARYALHKLICATLRPAAMQAKAAKDILQSAQVLDALLAERAGDLQLAAEEIRRRGRSWIAKIRKGLTLLKKDHPQIAGSVSRLLA